MQKDEEVGKVAQATPIVICVYVLQPALFPFDFLNVQPKHWSCS
jgi:hypothetical protein